VSIDSRLRRLEERAGEGRCLECSGGAGIVVTYPSGPGVGTTAQRCPRCGRALTLIRVVYDGAEEGGGG
jgi:hypothetical protein